jgi:large subunit ribosomal protein L32e
MVDTQKLKSMKKTHPKFFRANFGRTKRKRIKDNWRKPRGIDNKKRIKIKYVGAEPNIGWRGRKEVRGLHPSGFKEVLISTPKELDSLGKDKVVRISSGVGRKKRNDIIEKSLKLGLKVVNQ